MIRWLFPDIVQNYKVITSFYNSIKNLHKKIFEPKKENDFVDNIFGFKRKKVRTVRWMHHLSVRIVKYIYESLIYNATIRSCFINKKKSFFFQIWKWYCKLYALWNIEQHSDVIKAMMNIKRFGNFANLHIKRTQRIR